MNPKQKPAGYLAFTLHAHLPYVIHHGTWPHGMEWLHEAAAETYLPLLGMLGRLEKDGVPAGFNINLSPILLEQLAHPTFKAEFPKYLTRKIVAAREDEAYFIQSGDAHLAETARFWHRFFTTALKSFEECHGDIISGFRRFEASGMIEIITSCATHGYLPLLGTDESVRAQIRMAVSTHTRHLGHPPTGIWSPECGYRPAGYWDYPVLDAEATEARPGFERIGVEEAMVESDLTYFFVDSHLVENSGASQSPYQAHGRLMPTPIVSRGSEDAHRSLYRPYYVGAGAEPQSRMTIFARDPRTGLQVWSGDLGYPADPNYLDFHKKRFPGGHRYWQVTGPNVDLNDKMPYWPHQAAERVKDHANHFVHLVYEALEPEFGGEATPILCAPFDAELFGHWWFEGLMWLEEVCRILHYHDTRLATITCSRYLEEFPRAGSITMHEGSWGAEGNHQVWMNPDTSWTYSHIYPAEVYMREVAADGRWQESELGRRIVQQMGRELLLLESSDWQFLITTGAARDYAEMRFATHNDQFLQLKAIWQDYAAKGSLSQQQTATLKEIEMRDNIFPDLDPAIWASSLPGDSRQAKTAAEAAH